MRRLLLAERALGLRDLFPPVAAGRQNHASPRYDKLAVRYGATVLPGPVPPPASAHG